MATNIEIKARVRDAARLRLRAEQLSGSAGTLLPQEDTFFNAPQGRLKLRVQPPGGGQLIYYERPDQAGPKSSHYLIYAAPEPAALAEVLGAALGVRGVVRKQRTLFMVGNTRVHLDEVEGLGAFMELEVVLQPGQAPREGEVIAQELMRELGVEPGDLIEGAYLDLQRG